MKSTYQVIYSLAALAYSTTSSHADTKLNATTSLWEATAPLNTGNVVVNGGIKAGTGNNVFEFQSGGVLISKGLGLVSTSLAAADQGTGTRLLWYPRMAAIRAGTVNGSVWDHVNIGYGSAAFGQNTKALGQASTALGNTTTAAGLYSTALGNTTTAAGASSTALGISTLAGSYGSTALGAFNVGIGNPTAWVATDPLFEIGNGTAAIPANALTVLKNGNTSISGALTTAGAISTAGQINFTGNNSGIFSNGTPLLSVNSTTNAVTFGTGRSFNISNTTASTTPLTGALTVAGGLGISGGINTSADATINGIRVGRGPGSWAGNLVVGSNCLISNTSGSENIAIGINALTSNTSGTSNLALGLAPLLFNTTGSLNTAMGDNALTSNTTGSYNTAYGSFALYSSTTGENNTAVGPESGGGISTGSQNTFIGFAAGAYLPDGTTYLSKAENSIYIGANSRGFSNADNNSIVIGAEAIGEGANTTVIGNSLTNKTHLFGQNTLTNVAWKTNPAVVPSVANANAEALVVEGHTRLRGKVILEQAQGDISMGIYQ